ncbi:uncharacterized protein LOC131036681 isoform X1 [Cryptomeria japonica]|uniref:uncharacterized protein LOC131036681 isoform X1 n=2 Tax=Cryptomeria japonica TaxID=3369 RepID=UPI0025AD2498|nr:uncharacterized protein LOC131036681 isoform X1 [Cryptomeria japonica]
MWKDGRLVIFNRLDAETPVIKSVSNVNLFPCSPGKVFQVGCISAILLSTLEALADPKRLVKGWKSVSKSTMQLIGFERRPVIIAVSNWKPVQGETLAIMVSVPPAENFIDSINLSFRANFCKHSLVEVTFEEERFSAFSTSTCPNKWRTLIPLSPLDTTGQRSLIVDVNDGRHESFHGVIEVLEKEYPTETIWLSGNKSGIHGTQKELDAVKVLVSNRTAKQYWDGSFRLPIHGEVTTEYGLKRCYNGVFASGYYHKGIDYGAPRGEPVWSPAAARVSLVGREEEGFALHGNCVGLDHGHGVTSILMHLDTILVENGMVVQAGDLLGTVGDTGLATGPHLHWGLYVHGKAVDQNQWLIEQSWLQ